jgi:hypothetical protein
MGLIIGVFTICLSVCMFLLIAFAEDMNTSGGWRDNPIYWLWLLIPGTLFILTHYGPYRDW